MYVLSGTTIGNYKGFTGRPGGGAGAGGGGVAFPTPGSVFNAVSGASCNPFPYPILSHMHLHS